MYFIEVEKLIKNLETLNPKDKISNVGMITSSIGEFFDFYNEKGDSILKIKKDNDEDD